MRLRSKILLSIFPIVGAALFLTGWLAVKYATRISHEAIYQYSGGILEAYVNQELAPRADILKKNKLDKVASFVSRYQDDALGAAGKLNLIWPGHLFVVDDVKNVIYCTSDEMSGLLPEVWRPIQDEVMLKADHRLKGHITTGEHESFVAQYFPSWGWTLFITIKGDFLHKRERTIWLSVALIGVLTSVIIVIALGLLLHKVVVTPVTHLRAATEFIATEERSVDIPVRGSDEFGELSRDIEGMSYRIHQSREELRRAYDDLKKLDEMKTTLVANVSHELRTPLTSILGFAKLGMRKLDKPIDETKDAGGKDLLQVRDAALRESLCVISEQSEDMAEVIDNIIVLMSLVAEEAEVEMHVYDLVDLVERVGRRVRDKVTSHGLAFSMVLPLEPVQVKLDKAKIELVLSHYISNAMTFTKRGRIDIKLTTTGDEVVVEVHDTGVGISAEDAEKVFDQFYQAGDVMTEKPKGLGVGLPICQKILHLHGGRVWLDSTLGTGSSFYFSLPLAKGDEYPPIKIS